MNFPRTLRSGAIALALKHARPDLHLCAIDASGAARHDATSSPNAEADVRAT